MSSNFIPSNFIPSSFTSPVQPASSSSSAPSSSPPQPLYEDCASCRVTSGLTLTILGAYSVQQSISQGLFSERRRAELLAKEAAARAKQTVEGRGVLGWIGNLAGGGVGSKVRGVKGLWGMSIFGVGPYTLFLLTLMSYVRG
jgi:hypothetical protein